MFNFSASIDRGRQDRQLPGAVLEQSSSIRTGTVTPEQPAASECCGLFLDD